MDAKHARCTAKRWLHANLDRWPGLRAAHLVGGITALPDGAPFPAHKDVDLHLIFAEGSPELRHDLPWDGLIEEAYGGIAIEAGVKSVAEYASASAVLGNPEVAHHLLLDSVLFDPGGLLEDLQATVRQEYRRRRWVRARLDHERRGLAGATALRAMAKAGYGLSGEVNILGYRATFAAAAMCVATLNPPKGGSGFSLRLKKLLAAYDRPDLYQGLVAALGLASVEPAQVEIFLREATEAFDLALEVKRTPGPFGHKLHRHLRPYFVDSVRALLDAGHHREALWWVFPYYVATGDVLLADGPDAEVDRVVARRERFLTALGLATEKAVEAAYAETDRIFAEIFALADAIIAGHPDVID